MVPLNNARRYGATSPLRSLLKLRCSANGMMKAATDMMNVPSQDTASPALSVPLPASTSRAPVRNSTQIGVDQEDEELQLALIISLADYSATTDDGKRGRTQNADTVEESTLKRALLASKASSFIKELMELRPEWEWQLHIIDNYTERAVELDTLQREATEHWKDPSPDVECHP